MYWGMTLRKKIILTFLISYVFFVGFMYLYLFHIHTIELPNSLIGTSVDPETFLSQDELILVNEYSAIRNFLFLLKSRSNGSLFASSFIRGWKCLRNGRK